MGLLSLFGCGKKAPAYPQDRVVAKDGSVNWDILATDSDPDSEPDSEQVEAQDNSSFRLSLNSVSVENAKIYYDKAMAVRAAMRNEFKRVYKDYDLIAK